MRQTRRRFRTPPPDLFHPLPQTPTWEDLPRPTQRQLTELLARLLREQHEPKAPRAGEQEADHE
jgi:hypothetical protein